MLAWAVTLHADWQPAAGPLTTRWTARVSPTNALPEYPRPQMVRKEWLNLNGLWQYAITPKDAPQPAQWEGEILVPYPVESALSGVMRRVGEKERLWYRRTFELPAAWRRPTRIEELSAAPRLLLHFGAVDWETTVWVNGRKVGTHRGGYDGFTFDLTHALKPDGAQELVVAVWDPTDAGPQPRGKQVRQPRGIWYTPTSGIWQTVWLEPVPAGHIRSLRVIPDFDASSVTVKANAVVPGLPAALEVAVLDGETVVAEGVVKSMIATRSIPPQVRPAITLSLKQPKPWSPDSPFLYGLRLRLRQGDRVLDEVTSYFGLRKIAVAKDRHGVNRLFLNNQPLFQFGPLDQGFWPDGLYTAPTDEALRYDLEVTKRLGFNMVRKHVKIEPDRWYYWCDQLGLLVWQDMPSGDRYIRRDQPDIQRSPASARQFVRELRALVEGRFNHPCIVMWVPYNEGWGQWDTARVTDLIKKWDPTRLVNSASGWTDRGTGDVHDIHRYPGPDCPPLEEKRAAVLGEFGGLGLPLRGHTWQAEKNWGYRSYRNRAELTQAYLQLIKKLHPFIGASGLAAAVYTQTSDVEIEVNGLMTYDRALIKLDAERVAAANRKLYEPYAREGATAGRLVPPATPLVACDPYFSIWSRADRLTDVDTTHWTGKPHRLTSLVRVDDKTYRVMGAHPAEVPALKQTDVQVLPTRTIYTFADAGIALTLTFLTAALPEDIELLARPVTYLTWDVRATDGQSHRVALYFDASAELTVNTPDQPVVWSAEPVGDGTALKIGSRDQPVLAKKGDDLRIDWGYLYVTAPQARDGFGQVAPRTALRDAFIRRPGATPLEVSPPAAAPARDWVAAWVLDCGAVADRPVSRWLMLAYDDLYSIQYMKHNLRPYWRHNGWEAADLLRAAARDYESLRQRAAAFDAELMADLRRVGGEQYAQLAALAYRQCFAAGKFVADARGQPIQFCKENHSNGCIGTSDVFYPMAPQFLLFGPSLAKSFLVPFMNYAASDRWKFPFAPHDLGQYPHANGQRYGGGERSERNQMPVEESGNLLILMAAVARMEGHADFAGRYWPQLTRWAEYLKARGFDPENQLCTDDFAGHLAHNVNLSAKAICGLAAYAKLCERRGEKARAKEYRSLAREFARKWAREADDGDHFRLAFDKPGTWSQKYNLVWDRILGLGLWPEAVRAREMAWYRKVQNRYGLPLDNRSKYTKLDWVLWSATLTQDPADFAALVAPVYRFLSETPDRVPMTDWYFTDTARRRGFTARPVVGGVFLQMLYDRALWRKYAGRDRTKAGGYAPLPRPPVVRPLVPTSETTAQTWRYTFQRPAADWFRPDFNDRDWREGPGGFGTRGTPGARVRTVWNTPDLWLRREIVLPDPLPETIQLRLHHDEDAEIYLNGVPAARARGYVADYEEFPLTPAGRAALRPGRNLIAVHCHQTRGGQYVDAGLEAVISR